MIKRQNPHPAKRKAERATRSCKSLQKSEVNGAGHPAETLKVFSCFWLFFVFCLNAVIMRLSRPIQKAVDRLIAELQRIGNVLETASESVQQQKKATDAAEERKEKQQGVQPLWLKDVLTKYDQSESDRGTRDDRHYRVQNSIRWATWCAFIGALIYGAIAYRQWTALQDQNNIAMSAFRRVRIDANEQFKQNAEQITVAAKAATAAEKAAAASEQGAIAAAGQASTAKKSIDFTIEQSRLDQRAWVGVKEKAKLVSFERDRPMEIDISLINSGRTPARNVRIVFNFALSPSFMLRPSPEQIKELEKGPFIIFPSIGPQQTSTIFGGKPPAVGNFLPPRESEGAEYLMRQFDKIKAKELIFYAFGEIRYDDVSDRPHITYICIFISDPDAKEISSCQGFNEIE